MSKRRTPAAPAPPPPSIHDTQRALYLDSARIAFGIFLLGYGFYSLYRILVAGKPPESWARIAPYLVVAHLLATGLALLLKPRVRLRCVPPPFRVAPGAWLAAWMALPFAGNASILLAAKLQDDRRVIAYAAIAGALVLGGLVRWLFARRAAGRTA